MRATSFAPGGRPYFYKLVGQIAVPCKDMDEWAETFGCSDRIVRQTQIGEIFISTVFLGVDHNHFVERDEPILFETMIFVGDRHDGGHWDGYQTRCGTWAEQLDMHEAALKAAADRHLISVAEFRGIAQKLTSKLPPC